jgi:hypothetical protein
VADLNLVANAGENKMAKKLTQPMLPGMPRNKELMSPATRYKRGYTPERKREITRAFDGTTFYIFPHSTRSLPKKIGNTNRARDHVISAVSKTNIPPNHLTGIHEVVSYSDGIPGEPLAGAKYETNPESSGTVNTLSIAHHTLPRYSGVSLNESHIAHEIGHHINFNLDSDGKLSDGTHEALADNYAEEHTGNKMPSGYLTAAHQGSPFPADFNKDYLDHSPPSRNEHFFTGQTEHIKKRKTISNQLALPFGD